MDVMRHRPPGPDRPAFAALGLCSAACVSMLTVRAGITGDVRYAGLAWNLLLAWAPFVCANVVLRCWVGGRIGRWAAGLATLGWLFFLPNGPYLVTDLIHWQQAATWLGWFDLIMLMAFAWTGCLLGFASLLLLHRRVASVVGAAAGWVFVSAASLATGLGVYLGRFPRWNSWDMLAQPAGVMADVLRLILHPVHHRMPIAFALLVAAVFGVAYLTLLAFATLGGARGGAHSDYSDRAR